MSIYTRTKIKKTSSGCGTNKTKATCEIAKETKHIKSKLIVQPTTKLIDKTAENLTKFQKIDATVIHGKNAIKRTVSFLNTCNDVGEVLMITWSCYSKLPLHYIKKIQNEYDVYIDEIPKVDEFYQFNLFDNKSLFKRYLKLTKSDDALVKVTAKNLSEIKTFIKSEDTVYSDEIEELFQRVISPYYDVYVDASDLKKNDENSRIYFMSMLNPHLFQGVTLLGANLEKSMLYHWFTSKHGVNFTDNTDIINKLDAPFDLSNRMRISYLTDKSNSMIFKNLEVDGVVNYQLIHKLVKTYFKDEKFLYCENDEKKFKTLVLDKLEKSEKIDVVSNGLNEYQDYKNIAFLPALNRSPQHFSMLDELGISSVIVKESSNFETMYQAIMRTCLRDKDSTEIVNVFVISKEEAQFLVSVTGNQMIKKVFESEYTEYQKIEPQSQSVRSKKYKFNKQLIEGETDYFKSVILKQQYNQIDEGVYFSWHDDFKAKSGIDQLSLMKLKGLLKSASKTAIKRKGEHTLINASVFNGLKRSNENYVSSSMLILDFDGGDIGIKDFESIFTRHGEMISFIICNSFSRDEKNPNKFRVYIPFNKPVYSIEHHRACFDAVLKRLEDNGYTQKSMMLDNQSRSAVASFFFPCVNQSATDYAYFKSYGWDKTATLKRCIFDVSKYEPIERQARCKVIPINSKVNDIDTKIEAVKQKYLAVPIGSKSRNDAFFDVGISLLNHLDFNEIENILIDLAGSDTKMKGRIKGVIKSLNNYKDVA